MNVRLSGRLMLGLLLAVLFPKAAPAADPSPDYFAYYPGGPLHLGGGFIQNDLAKQFAETCVKGTPQDASPGTGAMYSVINVTLVKDYASLLEKMGLDAKVDVHTPTSSFSASFNDQRERVEDRKSITVVVQVAAEYSAKLYGNVELTPGPAQLLEQGLVDEFIERCGARIVTKERRGVMLSAVISLSEVSEKNRRLINASVGGGYGAGGFSASAKAAFNSELSKAHEHHTSDISYYGIGGQPAGLRCVDQSRRFRRAIDRRDRSGDGRIRQDVHQRERGHARILRG